MAPVRRFNERRRRVLMQSSASEFGSLASSNQKQWREAPNRPAQYGTRVRSALRGRWFHLVPLSRSAMGQVTAVVMVVVLCLVGMNHWILPWISSGERPGIVAVFQIGLSGSLASYVHSILLLLTSGSAWLIYQLRRYRNDDFRGEYRLWRSIVICTMLASLAAVVPVIGLAGELLEWSFGRRVALSGTDWVLLLVTLGGTVLALRTIMEMRTVYRPLVLLMFGWGLMAIPVASRFNAMAIDSPWRWSLVTSAPLAAAACWFLSSILYLRCLYADVLGVRRSSSLWQRVQSATVNWSADRRADGQAKKDSAAKEKPDRMKTVPKTPSRSNSRKGTESTSETESKASVGPTTNESTGKRRWWSRRVKSDKASTAVKSKRADRGSSVQESSSTPDKTGSTDETSSRPAGSDQNKPKRRFGLASMMKRGAKTADSDSQATQGKRQAANAASSPDTTVKPRVQTAQPQTSEQPNEDSDIDWSSMSKAERRRMRKQLKRGGRAA
ncbi:MAG: hypothetical protein AAGJ40_20865 [Planctomycetota bacterium]